MPKIFLPYYYADAGEFEDNLLDHQSETELSEHPEGSTLGNYYTTSIHNTSSLNPLMVGTTTNSGLMSATNGDLDTLNLDTGTTIKAQHIMPEQACLARMEGMRPTNTVYGNSSGTLAKHYESGADSSAGTLRTYDDIEQFFNLPGLSLRWYQPYDASAALLQWSFFVSFNSWMGRYKDAVGKKFKNGVYTTIRLRCVLDGEPLHHTERVLGENFFHPVSPGANNRWSDLSDSDTLWGPGFDEYDVYGVFSEKLSGGNPRYVSPEAHSALQFDLHHLIGAGTDTSGKYVPTVPTAILAKGYHEIGVQCSIDAMQTKYGEMSGPVFLQNVGKATAVDDVDTYEFKGRAHFNLTGKLSLGIRNARVMSFL